MKHKPDHIRKKDWDAVDSPPLSDEILARMRPARVRGPQQAPLKVPVSIRLNHDVVKYFKSQGKGWQTQINTILRKYVETHRVL